jgi:hypothetical protein
MGGIFGPRRVGGRDRKLEKKMLSEELYDFFQSSNVVGMIMSVMMKQICQRKSSYTSLGLKLGRKRQLERCMSR